MLQQGDIFWIEPEALRPCVPGARHPHVVIQEDILNRSRIPTTVVCALSSNLKRANEPGNVLLELGEGGLSEPSVVVVSRICSVDKEALTSRIGTLEPIRIEQIRNGLRFLERSFFVR